MAFVFVCQMFLFEYVYRYYWRKSTMLRGIQLTKVQTTWPQISYVDAAVEVPLSAAFLFQGAHPHTYIQWDMRKHSP